MPGDDQGLILTFDGARTGDDGQVAVADSGLTHLDAGVLGFGFPTHQLIGLGYRHRFLDPGQTDEQGGIHRSLIVQHADGDTIPTGYGPGRAAPLLNDRDHPVDLLGCGIFFHYYQHVTPP
jgi:hypothetical protein